MGWTSTSTWWSSLTGPFLLLLGSQNVRIAVVGDGDHLLSCQPIYWEAGKHWTRTQHIGRQTEVRKSQATPCPTANMSHPPSNRLKVAPSGSSLFQSFSKSPGRKRAHEPRLSLKRVVGTTCNSPVGFDSAASCFAYVAGGSVVVVDVRGGTESQRFYRARPTALPVFSTPAIPQSSSGPNAAPRANDARRIAKSSRGSPDWSDSPPNKTWTSRERIKAATCVSLSRDGRFLAAGETGYAPRVLIFSLKDTSSDQPLVSISEHGFGVRAVAWSQDGRYLASLGTANDGFLFIWKIDTRTGSARLFQQNRCTSYVAGMVWLGSNLVTFGTRHVKYWKVLDETQQPPSPSKKFIGSDTTPQSVQKTLPGRNVLLGSLLEATFTCAFSLDETHALLCSDGGDVCLLDDMSGQMRLTRITKLEFAVASCAPCGRWAVVGGLTGQLARFDVDRIMSGAGEATIAEETGSVALAAMGLVQDQLVTIGTDRSIDIWKAGSFPEFSSEASAHIRLPGQNDPVLGIQPLTKAADHMPAFFTWSGSGKVLLWDLNGRIRESFEIVVDDIYTGNDLEPSNQLCVVRADEKGEIFAAGDRVGVLRIVNYTTGEPLLETKAHASEITHVAVYHGASRAFVVTSGRDRTVQIYYRTISGSFDLLQTLQFPSRVTDLIISPDEKILTSSMDRNVHIHELVLKDGNPGALAFVQCKSIALKASPTSMVLDSDGKSLYVSHLDKTINHFNVDSGRGLGTFRCLDENGSETAVLDSLVFGPSQRDEPSFLLGLSNTDKSVRLYDSNTGTFVDREWGHTESINGVALVDGGDDVRNVVSVGCDGTIMIWDLDLRDSPPGATSRSPSPMKDSPLGVNRPPLRRVLSKADVADFQRPTSSHNGHPSPPSRTLRSKKSRPNMSSSSAAQARTPTSSSFQHNSQGSHSRTTSSNRSGSPTTDTSPASARLARRPSMPALGSTPSAHQTARKKSSAVSLRSAYGFGSLQSASEQTCRQLRAYRKKLSSTEPITPETMADLEAELRLTAMAVAERADRSRQAQAITEPVLSGLLDQYSEKLVNMLDEKLRVRLEGRLDENGGLGVVDSLALLRLATNNGEQERPRTSYTTTSPMGPGTE